MNSTTIDKLARVERIRREILNCSDLIPTLPDLVVRVIDLLNRGDTEPAELERHIQCDQVLVAKLLGMVNSPFYAMNRKIGTVSEAVMVLGFRGLRSLVLASSTVRFLARDFSVYGYAERGLWLHALTTATAARTIAREARLGAQTAEELFVAGLLHDVGKMLLSGYLRESLTSAIPSGANIAAIERDTIGLDHTEAGALVCAKWNLSEELQEIIKHHHAPGEPVEYSKQVAAVRLADAYAQETGHGFVPNHSPAVDYCSRDLSALGFDATGWEDARVSIDYAVDAALTSLEQLC